MEENKNLNSIGQPQVSGQEKVNQNFQPPKIDYDKVAKQYEEKQQDALITPIRKYKQDMADTIKGENLSTIQIAIKESQKRQREDSNIEEKSLKNPVNLFFIIASLALVLLGGGLAWYFYG